MKKKVGKEILGGEGPAFTVIGRKSLGLENELYLVFLVKFIHLIFKVGFDFDFYCLRAQN